MIQPIFIRFASAPTAPPTGLGATVPLEETSASAGRPGAAAGMSAGAGRFIVGGRYEPLLARGLLGAPGAPIRRAWSSCGFTTLALAACATPCGGLMGVNAEVFAGPDGAAGSGAPSLSDGFLASWDCCMFLGMGLDDVWSTPGVFRIDVLSNLGLNSC